MRPEKFVVSVSRRAGSRRRSSSCDTRTRPRAVARCNSSRSASDSAAPSSCAVSTSVKRKRKTLRAHPYTALRSKGSLQITQLTPEFHIRKGHRKLIGFFQPSPNLLIDFVLVLVVVGQCAMDLSEGKIRVLKVDLLWT